MVPRWVIDADADEPAEQKMPVKVARDAFAGFARSAGILKNAPIVPPWMAPASDDGVPT